MKVVVVPPNLAWPAMFREESLRVASALGANAKAVHHIGSTSIPGIWAKPVIDILVEVKDLSIVDRCDEAMRDQGYVPKGEFGIPARRFFLKDDPHGTRTHHVHVFESASRGAIRHLAFRDFMREEPALAQEYSDLKRGLAVWFPDDIQSYMDGKHQFIIECEAKAVVRMMGLREGADGFEES